MAIYFLGLNNIEVIASNKDYVEIALSIARGEADIEAVYLWFCQNTTRNAGEESNAN